MEERNQSRGNFLNFERRLEEAKKDLSFQKILQWTLNKNKVGEKEGLEIYPPGFDAEPEALKNYLLWEQGQLKIDDEQ